GRLGTDDLGPGALGVDDDTMRAPHGAFLVAYRGEKVVGCGGLRHIPPTDADPAETSVAEIKRTWVASSERGSGLGSRLLRELESVAWRSGDTVVRLDTNEVLVEAIGMYRRRGYRDIEPYNTNPDPTHWFEKQRPSDPVSL